MYFTSNLFLSGPSTIWEALLVLSIYITIPIIIVLVISNYIIKNTKFYLEKIKANLGNKILYWFVLFVLSFLICLLGFFIIGLI